MRAEVIISRGRQAAARLDLDRVVVLTSITRAATTTVGCIGGGGAALAGRGCGCGCGCGCICVALDAHLRLLRCT